MSRLEAGRIDVPTQLEVRGLEMQVGLHVRADLIATIQPDPTKIYFVDGTWVLVDKGVNVKFDKEKD